MFGGYRSRGRGDASFLICHATSYNQVRKSLYGLMGDSPSPLAGLAVSKIPHVWQSHSIKHVLYYGVR